jgi:hypothetical protein|tara:strand:+ start:760 stop:1044 length:285 start_codon:yes stop_codon:yes gene_type:complete
MKKVREYDPVWKRWKTTTVVEEPKVHSGVEQQLELNLSKPREATAEEWDEWQEKELNWWGDIQLPIVFIMALVQLGALVFMFSTFYIISLGLGK